MAGRGMFKVDHGRVGSHAAAGKRIGLTTVGTLKGQYSPRIDEARCVDYGLTSSPRREGWTGEEERKPLALGSAEMSDQHSQGIWRRWLRLSVRGLMILVLILGGGIGWIVHRARVQRDAVAAIEKAGGWVRYDWESGKFVFLPRRPPGWPRWLVDRLGIDYFGNVVSVELYGRGSDAELVSVARLDSVCMLNLSGSSVTDAGLCDVGGMSCLFELCLDDTDITDVGIAHLKRLTNLRRLCLDRTDVTDHGVAHLQGLTRLTKLSVNDTAVSGEGLAQIAGLPCLSSLMLEGTQATGADMVHLKRLSGMEYLRLNDTRLDDVGIAHLKGLTALRHLDLRGTLVTATGVQELREALPNVEILLDLPDPRSNAHYVKIHGNLHPWDSDRSGGLSHALFSRAQAGNREGSLASTDAQAKRSPSCTAFRSHTVEALSPWSGDDLSRKVERGTMSGRGKGDPDHRRSRQEDEG